MISVKKEYDGRGHGSGNAKFRFEWLTDYIVESGESDEKELWKLVKSTFEIGIDKGSIKIAKSIAMERVNLLQRKIDPTASQTTMPEEITNPLSAEEYYVQTVAKEVALCIRESHRIKELAGQAPTVRAMVFYVDAKGKMTATFEVEETKSIEVSV